MPRVRHWAALASALLTLGLALGLTATHTALITPHDLRLNHDIQTTLHTGWLSAAMPYLTDTAAPGCALLLTALLVEWLVLRRRPAAALAAFLVIATGCAAVEIAKLVVARPAPPTGAGAHAYPSGHTGFALSLALAVCFLARETRWARPVFVLGAAWAAVIGCSRLYLGAHYPSDVLGSVLIVGAAVAALTGVWHRWIACRLVVPETRTGPPTFDVGGPAAPKKDQLPVYQSPG